MSADEKIDAAIALGAKIAPCTDCGKFFDWNDNLWQLYLVNNHENDGFFAYGDFCSEACARKKGREIVAVGECDMSYVESANIQGWPQSRMMPVIDFFCEHTVVDSKWNPSA